MRVCAELVFGHVFARFNFVPYPLDNTVQIMLKNITKQARSIYAFLLFRQ